MKMNHSSGDSTPVDTEKFEAQGIDTVGAHHDISDPDAHLSPEERAKIVSRTHQRLLYYCSNRSLHIQDKKLLWKLDLKLIPWLSLLYLISFIDR